MKETRIPEISTEMRKRIKRIARFHYGFKPRDKDIDLIDDMVRNDYVVMHDARIVWELATQNAISQLLKVRDKIGSAKFERIWLEKSMFRYLSYASMCFRAGISEGTISLCRTAIESGLRERIAEELAGKEHGDPEKLPEVIWEKMQQLRDETLAKLMLEAENNGIIRRWQIEDIFKELKFGDQDSRRVLDKFIHGDIVWKVDFVRNRGGDMKVVGAKDRLQEYKIISESKSSEIAIKVLEASYKIAEILYYRNI